MFSEVLTGLLRYLKLPPKEGVERILAKRCPKRQATALSGELALPSVLR